ncbi:unnamed protein product [Linum tenue]|uniref:GDSL esterase/lipase EXL3 n=1 Tax=Linum tenue TaxID=586396 RepID=A0AAV0I5H6_9ROSI|nr:unnamed protein product [Linum tenue]
MDTHQLISNMMLRNFYSVMVITTTCVSVVVFPVISNAAGAPKKKSAPAILVFGDSIVDPGNNNHVATIVKCDFPPYGRDFVGAKPTGRFCNGKVPSDFAANILGLKELVPAYLDPTLTLQDLATGVSFASGGSGYDPLTARIVSVLSLSDQVELFKEYLNKIRQGMGEEAAATIISQSAYLICVGSDDIANTYFSTPTRRLHYDINAYTDLMARYASTFYEVCSNSSNQAAQLFNSKLSAVLDSLSKTHPDALFVYLDVYNRLTSIIHNPIRYGFEVVVKGCCGTGTIEASILCTSVSDSHTCKDASKYLFWDSYHPSEKGYGILSDMVINEFAARFM